MTTKEHMLTYNEECTNCGINLVVEPRRNSLGTTLCTNTKYGIRLSIKQTEELIEQLTNIVKESKG